jgi:hypothetical protein
MGNKKNPEKPSEYHCEKCNFITLHKSDFNKHLLTAKHLRVTNGNEKTLKNLDKYVCDCGKNYKNRHTLSRHKKTCNFEAAIVNELVKDEPNANVIMELIKENKEFKSLLMEQQKENQQLINKLIEVSQQTMTVNNINTTHNNNNNQKFNLNFFLNETCKDAMNIQDFIDSIKITFDDLLTIGNNGFVNGVSDILIKQLRDLEVSKRPIHCTDSKRETIYLKENDTWEKDDKENKKLKRIIEKVEYKNVAALHKWCNENPDSKINNSSNNLLRDKIYLETLQGDERTRDKIIKNISREVAIEKIV